MSVKETFKDIVMLPVDNWKADADSCDSEIGGALYAASGVGVNAFFGGFVGWAVTFGNPLGAAFGAAAGQWLVPVAGAIIENAGDYAGDYAERKIKDMMHYRR
ncbi:MAG: hypothetical protein EBQ96_02280 [Proteobacteria bacterium]|nr:hypothetical protein [Pseudomonadota bacterium]